MKVKNIKIFSAILLVFIFNLIAPNMKVNASKNDENKSIQCVFKDTHIRK